MEKMGGVVWPATKAGATDPTEIGSCRSRCEGVSETPRRRKTHCQRTSGIVGFLRGGKTTTVELVLHDCARLSARWVGVNTRCAEQKQVPDLRIIPGASGAFSTVTPDDRETTSPIANASYLSNLFSGKREFTITYRSLPQLNTYLRILLLIGLLIRYQFVFQTTQWESTMV